MPKKKTYSDQQRAETLVALDANGGNVSKTSRETGIPRKTIAEWRDGRVNADVQEMRERGAGVLADKMDDAVDALLGDIMDEKRREKASLTEIATAIGILTDKMQLLRGNPTSIGEQRGGLTLFQQINQSLQQ